MPKFKVANKTENILEKIFIYCFMLYAALGSNVITYGKFIISIVMWPTFALGLLIILYKLVNYKEYIKMPAIWCLIGLLFSVGVSVLLNIGPAFKDNVIVCLHWAYCFLILYLINQNKTTEQVRKDMHLMLAVFVAYTLIAIIGSILYLILGISGKVIVKETGYEYFYGFKIGRLFGVFISANNGAMTSAATLAILIYYLCRYKRTVARILCGIAIALCIFYIALSDSRTGAVCTGVSAAVIFAVMYLYKQKDKSLFKKLLVICIVAVVGIVGFVVPRLTQKGYNKVIAAMQSQGNSSVNSLKVDRPYDMEGDISNRRFDVWNGGFELFMDSPKTMAVGTSFKEFPAYAKANQPKNYLVDPENGYGTFTTLDNEVINIMVAQGVLGLIPFAALIVVVLRLLIMNFYKVKKENQLIVACLLAGVITLTSAAMFGSVMFYHMSPNTIFFWVILGGLMCILRHDAKETVNE